ncbi:hypothetical protein [Polynucleobacter sp. Fuers-14]|uniref:hypothetical protein n=1 Tax=Polynucleobacter sp. Fuers-14 TaxID=1758364 RepID=UPI001C0E2DE4|nr:hypothetical protein [Polynucleobacter sp. Fuers-14]MBU3640820.1 hypothetical protein [Polynucleobacter sp. Fuers-14]
MKKTLVTLVVTAGLMAGCASTGTGGIVEISPNLYMLGELGGWDYTASSVKARLYKQANTFCLAKNLTMSPVSDTGTDYGLGTYASAEIKFRCVPK